MIFEALRREFAGVVNLGTLWQRLWQSAVVWSWGFNILRVASGLLLLPLLLRLLPTEEFGFYYLFVNMFGLVALMDFGLLNAIDRFVVYAMGGVTELKAIGMATDARRDTAPNYALVWKLLCVTRRLYVFLTLILVVLLGSIGTFIVHIRATETQNPRHTWLAWSLVIVSAAVELYSGWWNIFLRGMNRVLLMTRIYTLAYAVRLVLSIILLLAGGGLLSVPIATILSALTLRHVARRQCMMVLAPYAAKAPDRDEMLGLIRTLWPNSWRSGLLTVSTYLTTNANGLICLTFFGLAANARYGLSVQMIYFIQGMAMAWIWVKWPLIGQYRARQDYPNLRRLFWERLHLQVLTFAVGCLVVIPLAPFLLQWLHTDKTILPTFWLFFLAANALLELYLASWSTLIATANRFPFTGPVIASNIFSFLLTLVLVRTTSLGPSALIISPLLAGSIFNYWYWPAQGAKSLKTRWLTFVFSRPR